MISIRRLFVAGIFVCSIASAEKEKRWPAGADEFATTISVPAGFRALKWEAPAINVAGNKAPLMLEARFRSADRKAEFATAIYYVRHISAEPEARRIAVVPGAGEKINDHKSNRRKIAGQDGGADYWIYDEETTVSGKGYTRYLLNSFSTSSLPGATSDFWEFRAADDSSRKHYAAAYRKWKDSLKVGED
ncbi:MAG: hypothetical protein QOH88_2758 [Verrucomicrobiota bacterium]|jgi:hypothetical protein